MLVAFCEKAEARKLPEDSSVQAMLEILTKRYNVWTMPTLFCLTNLTSISQAVPVAISNPSNVSYAPVSLVWFPCPQESNFPIAYVRLSNCNIFKGIYSPLFTKGKLASWYVIHLTGVLLLYEPICCHPAVAHNQLETCLHNLPLSTSWNHGYSF